MRGVLLVWKSRHSGSTGKLFGDRGETDEHKKAKRLKQYRTEEQQPKKKG